MSAPGSEPSAPTNGDRDIASGERFAALGGIGVAVASIFPWYEADELDFDSTRTNGWQEPDAILSQAGIVVGVAVVVIMLATRGSRRSATPGSVTRGTLLSLLAAASLALLALKFSLNLDLTTVGIYVALTAATVELYGAYLIRLGERGGAAPSPAPQPSLAPQQFAAPTSPPRPTIDTRPPPPQQAAAPPTAGIGSPVQPAAPARPEPAQPTQPAQPAPQAAASPQANWPETAYLLAAWVQPAPSVDAAADAYRTAFVADPARLGRLRAELQALLASTGSTPEPVDALVAANAPRWAAQGGRDVCARIAARLAQ